MLLLTNQKFTLQAVAFPRLWVTLRLLRVHSTGIAVAGHALNTGVAPEVLLALIALPPSKARLAVTLPCVQIAALPIRSWRI